MTRRSSLWQTQCVRLRALTQRDLLLAALLWLATSLAILTLAAHSGLTRQRQLFDNVASHIRALLDTRLTASESIMLGLSEISHQQGMAADIGAYASQTHSRYPFIYLLGFQPKVLLQQRGAYEARQSQLHLTPIRIRDFVPQLPGAQSGAPIPWSQVENWRLAPARPFYLPLTVTEPSDVYPSRFMLGLDLLPTRALGPALRQSLRSAETEVSQSLTLSNGHPGLAYVRAIFQPRQTGINNPSSNALAGVALLVIQADALLADIALPSDLSLSLQRVDGPERIALRTAPDAAPAWWQPRFETRLGMRQSYFPYQLHVSRQPALSQLLPAPLPYLPVALLLPGYLLLQWLGRHRLRQRGQQQQLAALQAAQQLASAALLTTVDAIIVLDLQLRVTHLNARASALLRRSPAEALGLPLHEVVPLHYELATGQDEDLAQRCLACASEIPLPLHCYLDAPTAKTCYVEGVFTPATDNSGRVQGVILTLRETSSGDARMLRTLAHRDERLKQHAAEYAHAARLASLGEMASGIAHEINQPLSAIASYNEAALTLLDDEDADRALLRRALQGSIDQAERAGHIIKGLRRLSSSKRTELVPVDINQAIRNAIVLASPELRQRTIHLTSRLHPRLPLVFADIIQIEQVLLNLIRNAIEASPDGRSWSLITITSRLAAHSVAVSVSDSGPGIPAERMPHIFSPFYSLKPQGMGLGLTICQTLIESFGGRIFAHNLAEGGAEFTFELPTLESNHRQDHDATDHANHLHH